jgi:hypothetical protein
MTYTAVMGSGTIICIPSFIKIGLGIQKSLVGDTYKHRDSKPISCLPLFFKEKKKEKKEFTLKMSI